MPLALVLGGRVAIPPTLQRGHAMRARQTQHLTHEVEGLRYCAPTRLPRHRARQRTRPSLPPNDAPPAWRQSRARARCRCARVNARGTVPAKLRPSASATARAHAPGADRAPRRGARRPMASWPTGARTCTTPHGCTGRWRSHGRPPCQRRLRTGAQGRAHHPSASSTRRHHRSAHESANEPPDNGR